MTRLVLTAGLLAALAACAPGGPGLRPDAGEEVDISRIERLRAAGDPVGAALAFEQAAQSQPPPAAGRLLIRAAEAWLDAGMLDEARQVLGRIEIATLADEDLVRLDLAQAELAMLRGDLANAGWLLASTADHLPGPLAVRHARLEARLHELQSRPVRGALRALDEAVDQPDFSGEVALALLLEFPAAELEQARSRIGDRPGLLPWIDLALSARENLLDDPALKEALTAWQRRWPGQHYSAGQAQAWIAAWRQTQPLPARVTVLLPGAGSPLQRPGQALRDGLLAGWLELAPDRRPQLDFRYLDSAPESIVAAWYDARESGSDLLIGPLDRHQAEALVALPDAGTIPALLLNLPEEPGRLAGGGEITALALPPEAEAELAAIHALATGHRRAIVLSQSTDWGRRVGAAFVSTFELGGGRIVAERSYDPELPDHSALLRELLEFDRSEARIRRLAGVLGPIESQPRRRRDFDLVFLGARAADGRLLRPQLEFFDAGDVMLMATSQIVDGAPQAERDRDLDGITTPMPPWFLDFTAAGVARQRAQTLFAGLDNATLSRLHALGRDAVALIPWLSMMRADPTLSLPGMMGTLSLPDGHVFRRDLPVVRIAGGLARPIESGHGSAAAR